MEREGDMNGEELEGIISAVNGSPATALTLAHQVDSTSSPSAPTTVDVTVNSRIVAAKIKLREQALIGTVAATPAPTASGFTLNVSPTSAFGMLME